MSYPTPSHTPTTLQENLVTEPLPPSLPITSSLQSQDFPLGFEATVEPPSNIKRCEACGVTSTPQWRRGPSGVKTLCNACGVKYSQGRPLIMRNQTARVVDPDPSIGTQGSIYYKDSFEPNTLIKTELNQEGKMIAEPQVLITKPVIDPKRRKKTRLPQPTQDQLLAIPLDEREMDSDQESVQIVKTFLHSVHQRAQRRNETKSRLIY